MKPVYKPVESVENYKECSDCEHLIGKKDKWICGMNKTIVNPIELNPYCPDRDNQVKVYSKVKELKH